MNKCIDCGGVMIGGNCANSTDGYCGIRIKGQCMTNLELAEIAARKRMHTFVGSEHHCGNRLRYTVSQSCVSCRLVKDEIKRRKRGIKPKPALIKEAGLAARERGEDKFHGLPCNTCGGTLRYTSDNFRCVSCNKRNNKGYYHG